MNQIAIQIKNLTKTFPGKGRHGPTNAVDGVNLQIKEGEFVCLLGPSGSGKTTVLRCVAGFEPATSGKIFVNGEDFTHVPAHKRGLPLVFQNYALFPHLTIFENLAYGLRTKRVISSEVTRRVNKIMNRMGLQSHGKKHPDQISGGQQQRVALGRALVLEPKILLFDEPLSNLDQKLRLQMRLEIKSLQESLGVTCLYVTHDQEEAMSLADRIVIMNHGKIEQQGTPMEIYHQPMNRFVADFMGRANFLKGVVHRMDGNKISLKVLGSELNISLNGFKPSKVGEMIPLVLRYESIHAVLPNESAIRGKIQHRIYLGDMVLYEVKVGDQNLFFQRPFMKVSNFLETGSEVGLQFSPSDLISLSK